MLAVMAQAVKARARARGRVRLWTLVTAAVARNGRDPRLVRGVHAAGANRAQWLERLSYCGSEQAAGTALTALVEALVTAEASLWQGDMK